MTSYQTSTKSSVLINIVFVKEEEEMASGESGHFQSLGSRNEAFVKVLMLEDSFKRCLAGSAGRVGDS